MPPSSECPVKTTWDTLDLVMCSRMVLPCVHLDYELGWSKPPDFGLCSSLPLGAERHDRPSRVWSATQSQECKPQEAGVARCGAPETTL